jgi:hypothetical protein
MIGGVVLFQPMKLRLRAGSNLTDRESQRQPLKHLIG